jgi:hypothetical protein
MTQPVELRERLRQRTRISTNKSPVTKSITPEQRLIWVQIALTLLPLVTACVYLFGMVWHMGYLGVFNVDSSEFPLSTEMNLLTGISFLVIKLVPYIVYPVAAVFIFMILWVISALTFGWLARFGNWMRTYAARIGESKRLRRVLMRIFKYAIGPHQIDEWGRAFERVGAWYFRYCYAIGTGLVISFMAYYSYCGGKDSAQSQIEKITQGTYAAANQLRYAKHPEGIPAIRIMCNAIQCTFWTKADGTIFLRHDQIDSVVIPEKSKKAEQKR